jgi:hypothetical protein
MKDAVRVAIHLPKASADAIFFKIVSDRKKFTHVAKLANNTDFMKIKKYLKIAYAFSLEGTIKS